MADIKTEKTVAEELREASARAREHLLPHVIAAVLPQTALVVVCGKVHDEAQVMCGDCILSDVGDRVLARLVATLLNAREPLASWLETEAHMAEKRGNSSDGHTFHALAVARVLNGGDRG